MNCVFEPAGEGVLGSFDKDGFTATRPLASLSTTGESSARAGVGPQAPAQRLSAWHVCRPCDSVEELPLPGSRRSRMSRSGHEATVSESVPIDSRTPARTGRSFLHLSFPEPVIRSKFLSAGGQRLSDQSGRGG
jgi:hypothetical protein